MGRFAAEQIRPLATNETPRRNRNWWEDIVAQLPGMLNTVGSNLMQYGFNTKMQTRENAARDARQERQVQDIVDAEEFKEYRAKSKEIEDRLRMSHGYRRAGELLDSEGDVARAPVDPVNAIPQAAPGATSVPSRAGVAVAGGSVPPSIQQSVRGIPAGQIKRLSLASKIQERIEDPITRTVKAGVESSAPAVAGMTQTSANAASNAATRSDAFARASDQGLRGMGDKQGIPQAISLQAARSEYFTMNPDKNPADFRDRRNAELYAIAKLNNDPNLQDAESQVMAIEVLNKRAAEEMQLARGGADVAYRGMAGQSGVFGDALRASLQSSQMALQMATAASGGKGRRRLTYEQTKKNRDEVNITLKNLEDAAHAAYEKGDEAALNQIMGQIAETQAVADQLAEDTAYYKMTGPGGGFDPIGVEFQKGEAKGTLVADDQGNLVPTSVRGKQIDAAGRKDKSIPSLWDDITKRLVPVLMRSDIRDTRTPKQKAAEGLELLEGFGIERGAVR